MLGKELLTYVDHTLLRPIATWDEIVGVGLLVNRSGGKAEFGVPKEKVQALLNLEVPTYKPEECPLCKDGVAMTERGSKHIK